MSQFRVEVIADSTGRWCSNGRLFATREDGEAYARDLKSRWTLVRECRVVEEEEPVNAGRSDDSLPSSPGALVINVTLGPMARLYRALCTTAPCAYDAGTSITLVTGTSGTIEALLREDQLLSIDKHSPARIVLVEANLFEWHRARYASGLVRECGTES